MNPSGVFFIGECNMRELIINDPLGKLTCQLPDKCCAFCKHCPDFFYDYTNGPYLFCCDLDLEPRKWETCTSFEDIEKGE